MYKYTSRTWTQEVMGTEGLAGAGSRGRSGERSGGGGWSEGERAGVDKFVFVLSTHESAHGEALYGVCIYWDEPCYLVLPRPTYSVFVHHGFSLELPCFFPQIFFNA